MLPPKKVFSLDVFFFIFSFTNGCHVTWAYTVYTRFRAINAANHLVLCMIVILIALKWHDSWYDECLSKHLASTYRHKATLQTSYTISSLVNDDRFDCCYCYCYSELHTEYSLTHRAYDFIAENWFCYWNRIPLCKWWRKKRKTWASHLKLDFFFFSGKCLFLWKKIENLFQI